MYLSIKIFSFLSFFMALMPSLLFSQTFTYSGPTNFTIPYGESSASGTYTFVYQNTDQAHLPELVVAVDGDVITSGLCEEPSVWLPSTYTINFTPGTHTVQFSLVSGENTCYELISHQEYEFTVTCGFRIRVENIFPGGTIKVDDSQTNAPNDRYAIKGAYFSMSAIDQNNGGYNWTWNTSGTYNSKWDKQLSGSGTPAFYSYSRSSSFYVANNNEINTKLIANLRKVCNVQFGSSSGRPIIINGASYNPGPIMPTPPFAVVEQNQITATMDNYIINEIDFRFQGWRDNQSQLVSSPLIPASHNLYSSVFKGYPMHSNRNLACTSNYEQSIRLAWNEHPSPLVTQYQIWRKVKHAGVMGPEQLIGTVNRGTLTFLDGDYILKELPKYDMLYYDVRAYYAPDATVTNPIFLILSGEYVKIAADNEATLPQVNMLYDNYPNPFNPSTQIKFAIKEESYVSLKVYDILGKEVKTLVNENISAGSYTYDFDGNDLPSGLYIYALRTKGYSASKKMMLTK